MRSSHTDIMSVFMMLYVDITGKKLPSYSKNDNSHNIDSSAFSTIIKRSTLHNFKRV